MTYILQPHPGLCVHDEARGRTVNVHRVSDTEVFYGKYDDTEFDTIDHGCTGLYRMPVAQFCRSLRKALRVGYAVYDKLP